MFGMVENCNILERFSITEYYVLLKMLFIMHKIEYYSKKKENICKKIFFIMDYLCF